MPETVSRQHRASCEAPGLSEGSVKRKGVPVGGGKRNKRDASKGPPVNGLGELGGGALAEVDVCAAPRTVEFLMTGAASAGALVTVLAGAQPRVFVSAGQIGVLVGQAGAEVQACLEQGYEMTGVIETADAADGTGRLRISGQLG
jgi:hypothetical protein